MGRKRGAMNRRSVNLLGFISSGVWTSTKGAGPAREEERGACVTVEVETESVRRKTEARGLELDQVTVGAVEVESESKEAETGG